MLAQEEARWDRLIASVEMSSERGWPPQPLPSIAFLLSWSITFAWASTVLRSSRALCSAVSARASAAAFASAALAIDAADSSRTVESCSRVRARASRVDCSSSRASDSSPVEASDATTGELSHLALSAASAASTEEAMALGSFGGGTRSGWGRGGGVFGGTNVNKHRATVAPQPRKRASSSEASLWGR